MKIEERTCTTADGKTHMTQIAVCGRCGNDTFRVFQIDDTDHAHFQCGKCGQAYCEYPWRCECKG